ncbi:hypothetical protein [Rhizobium arsenicireducens]
MINIIDGHNYFRRLVSVGSDARSILNTFLTPKVQTIVVWDGERGSQRRRDIYPQYKTNRTPLDKDISLHFTTLVKVLSHCDVTQMMHPGYEGDDVIATLAREYAGAGQAVHIESTDADFLQLKGEFPKLVTCTAAGKVPPELTLLYKIWVGDPADKISGIPTFGPKTWERTDLEQLQLLTTTALKSDVIIDIGLPPAVKPTVELIKSLHAVVSFFDVPRKELLEHVVFGRPNYAAADAYLKEFFQ